jgi:hypothetical protein
MSKRPDDRYPSITIFATALREAIEASDAPPPRLPVSLRAVALEPEVALESQVAPATEPVTEPVLERAPVFERERERIFERAPVVESVPGLEPAGRETLRLIRKTRRKIRGGRSGTVLLALAAVAAFAWFSPATRGRTRAAWIRASAEARRMSVDARRAVEGASTRRRQASSASAGVSMP